MTPRTRPVIRLRLSLVVAAAFVCATLVAAAAVTHVRSEAAFTRFQDAGTLLTRADATDLGAVRGFDTVRADAATLSKTAGAVVSSGKALFDGGLLNKLATARAALDTAAGAKVPARPTRTPLATPGTAASADTGRRQLTTAANRLATHAVAVSRARAAITAAAHTVRTQVAAITATLPKTVAGVTGHNPDAAADTITRLNQAADAAKRDGDDPAGLVQLIVAADAVAASDAAAKAATAAPAPSGDDGASAGGSSSGGSVRPGRPTGNGGGSPAAGGGSPSSPGAPVTPGGSAGGGGPAPAGPPPESPNPEDHVQDANPQFRQIGCLDIVTYSQTTSYGGVVVVNVNYPYDRTVEKVGSDWKVTVYTCF